MWNELMDSIRLTWYVATSPNRSRVRDIVREIQRNKRSEQKTPSAEERQLLTSIQSETSRHNRNNLTRTDAYLRYFSSNPEIHWSLLAHLVSRNGGWNMTDLRGEWFTRIASAEESNSFFDFLERANWLIFGDAYPQLLLYQEGKKRRQNLSHLLGSLNVSRFMEPIWNHFWTARDGDLLTRALIVNEQNYIEARVLQNAKYSPAVVNSVQYQVQSLFNLNQVVIPFYQGSSVRLSGTVVRRFVALNDRIDTGKRLYRILYQDKRHTQAILRWVNAVNHTGSRADYWPEMFGTRRQCASVGTYRPRFVANAASQRRVYSPKLADVWPDVQHSPAESGDWFHSMACIVHLFDEVPRQPVEFTDTYVQSAQTLEHMLMAKDKLKSLVE